ncbi:MAG: PLDc N-terminal domain-containing protein [Nanoarchaeota archaeon]
MGFGDVMFWPFTMAFAGAMAIVALIALVFWIWMLVDCSKRKFKNNVEKIVWIVAIVLAGWVGALVYLIVIRSINPSGLARH